MTEEKLKQIKKLGDDKRLPAYKALTQDLNNKQDIKGLLATVKHLVKVEGEDTHGRTYITSDALLHFLSVIGESDEKKKSDSP